MIISNSNKAELIGYQIIRSSTIFKLCKCEVASSLLKARHFQQLIYKCNFLSPVIGCPDIDPPSDGFVDREGDVAVISCKEPDTSSWEITCENGDWSGYYGNCSVGKCTYIFMSHLPYPHMYHVMWHHFLSIKLVY